MGLIKSKAEKEQERKMQVRRSMKELEKRIAKLREQETIYIKTAQEAMREDLPEQVKLAKEALKMTISERKRTYQMLLNARIMAQMKDMSAMTNEFLQAMHVISRDIARTTTADMSKISTELKLAMQKVSAQTENFTEMMADAQDDMVDISADSSMVSDDEIDKLIYGNAEAGETSDESIDSELEKLRKQLDK